MIDLIFYDGNEQEIPSLTQWDLGRVLYIRNTENLVQTPVFHFYNRSVDESTPVLSEFVTINSHSYIKVDVPNEILQKSLAIHVHMGVANNANELETIGTGVITVIQKAKPSYYEYVQNIADIFDETISRKLEEELEGGSPKGVFATKSDLTNENSGLYVCMTANDDTSATPPIKSGYLYYWDSETNTLSYLGIQYQSTGIPDGSITEDMLSTALKKLVIEDLRKFESTADLTTYMESEDAEAGQLVRVKETVNGEDIYQVYILQNGTNNTLIKKKINSNEEALRALENTVSALSEDLDNLENDNDTTHTDIINRFNNNAAGGLVYNSSTKALQLVSIGDDTENSSQAIGSPVIIDTGITGVQLAVEPDKNDNTKNYLFLRDSGGTDLAYVELPATGTGNAGYVVMRLKNLLSSTTFTVPYNEVNGCECLLVYNFTSIDTGDNNSPTGNGTAYYYVNNTLVLTTQNLVQGNHTVDIGSYLTPNSTNNIRVMVVDSEGNRKTLSYTITVAYNYLTSDFDALSVQNGAFSIPYTPNGSGDKIIYCVIDGDTAHKLSYQTNKSAQTFYFDISGLSHGGHFIEIYMSTLLEGQSERVTSNVLTFGVVMISSNTPVLYAKPSNTTIQQYSYNNLDFIAHSSNQQNTVSAVVDEWVETQIPVSTIEIDGDDVDCITVADATTYEITVDENAETITSSGVSYYKLSDTNVIINGTKKYITTREYATSLTATTDEVTSFPYRFVDSGIFGVTLTFGELSQTVVYTVESIDVAEAETNGLKYLFDPSNRSNKEDISTRGTHSYTNGDNETYNTIFSGIDFEIYGWTGTSLKIPHGGSMTIPYKPFLTDTNTTKGKTIEFSFKIKNVYDYAQNIISCIANNMGINILANKGNFTMGSSSAVEVQYVEDEEIRLSFVIAKRNSANDYRSQLVYVFVNSILSGVFQYGQADSFVQNPAAGITIGSNYAEIELYKVRCYDIELFNVQQGNTSRSYKILNNFIADSPDVNDMIERNARNDVFDESNSIDNSLLPDDCPYMVIESDALPSARTDEFVISGYFVDKADSSKAFVFSNAKIKTQGTSSLDYFIKNFKITFKNGVLFEIGANIVPVEVNGENVDCVLSDDITTYGITLSNNAEVIEVVDEGTTKTYYRISDTNIVVDGGINYIRVGKYQLFSDSIPTNKFCLKADVASSEGANNTVLMKIWDDITRALYRDGYDTLTPPQIEDERVRQSIDSRPMVLYWRDISNPNNPVLKFWGKYNFNNDKGTHEVYGFNETKYPECQCWEFRDNGKALSQFKSTDFDTLVPFTDKKTQDTFDAPRWYDTFEPRFPEIDDELPNPYTQVSVAKLNKLKRVISWVCSTDTTQADDSVTLANSVEYDGVTYTTDSVEYRLAKFKNEFTDYFKKDLTLLYYIFTDVFLIADNREKNQMITTFDGIHWFFIPYDGDTALGINNSGKYGFEYWLEGDSVYNGANVYNGRPSVLWNNVATVFAHDIQLLCTALLSARITNRDSDIVSHFGFEYVRDRFNKYQSAWSEAIFCADAEHKYIVPYIELNDARYLSMAQGSKRLQREYWLRNRFKYWCSKYKIGDATDVKNGINIRMTTPEGMSDERYVEVYNPCGNPSTSYYYEKTGNTYFASTDTSVDSEKTYYVKWNTLIVTSLTNTYVLVGFGQNLIPYRCNANESIAAKGNLDSNGDSPLNFYNASEIKNVGDLSQSYVSNFTIGSNVKNLESIVIGNEDNSYENTAITQLSTSSCEKLKVLNVSNCKNLGTGNVKYIDISKCFNIREVLAKGTKITAVNLASGSQIRTLKLPNTIMNLELINQTQLSTFEMEGYSNLLTLKVQNTPIDVLDIVQNATGLTNINLIDINWTFEDTELLDTLVKKNKLDTCTVQLTGRVYVPELTSKQLSDYTAAWGNGLLVDYSRLIVQYPVTFKNYDGTVLKNDDNESAILYVNEGETPYDAIVIDSNGDYYTKDELGNADELLFRKPTKPYAWDETYEFDSWDNNLSSRIREAVDYTAQYTTTARQYEVQFKFTVAGQAVQTTTVTAGDTVTYDSSNGQPSKASDGNNWYLCRGWTDTGQEYIISTTDESRIYGLFATITLNEALLADFAATVPTVLKPTLVFNTIYNECSLPTSGIPRNPTKTDIKNYLDNYRYVYTNDPELQEQSAYTLGELYAISMSEKYSLYLPLGSRARIICDTDTYIGGDTAGDGKGKFEIEVMGYNVYERADSGFAGVGDCGGATNAMISGDYQGQKIKGMISSPTAMSELSGKSAGLYICNTQGYQCDTDGFVCDTSTGNLYDSDGCVYYYNGETSPTKVGAYFSHVVWSWVFSDSTGAGGQYMDATYCMNNTAPNPHTINGWGNDEAEDYKKCVMNNWLNGTVFGYLPSELQGVITPVKVVSGRGRASASDNTFKITPVSSVSRLFLLSAGEVFGRNDTPYVNEISKWSSLAVRNANDEISSISRYWRLTSNNVRLKHPYYGTGSSNWYWLRSPYSTSYFVNVNGTGNFNNGYANGTSGVSPAFCTG